MTPSRPGECVRLQVQEDYHGQWRVRGSTPCAALGQDQQSHRVPRGQEPALGLPYRIRAVFISGRDTTVHRADSGWHYLIIEKQPGEFGRTATGAHPLIVGAQLDDNPHGRFQRDPENPGDTPGNKQAAGWRRAQLPPNCPSRYSPNRKNVPPSP